ncbi:MAG: tetratricopeptide repeat protein [Magnetococcus sp. DMHC-8]
MTRHAVDPPPSVQPSSVRQQAFNLYTGDRFSELLVLAEGETVLFQQDAALLNLVAICHVRLGRPAQAVAAWQQALRLAPDHVDLHYNIGVLQQEMHHPVEAAAAFRQALRFQPDHVDARRRLGELLDEPGPAQATTASQPNRAAATSLARQYIDLLKKSLLNALYIENEVRLLHTFQCMLNKTPLQYSHFLHIKQWQSRLFAMLQAARETGETVVLMDHTPDTDPVPAYALRNVTELSHTMIGKKRLENLQYCIETVLAEQVPGDFMETGIWRGGACIFMRGVLKAYGVTDRIVWAADSFAGVPVPTLPEDAGFDISRHRLPVLAVSLEEVQELFARYDLLDDRVRFLPGWFKDTLPTAPIGQLAILRLDGDLYESTMDALVSLYDKVVRGGFVIVDDYGSCPPLPAGHPGVSRPTRD